MKLHLQLLINIVRYLRWKFPVMLILMGLVAGTEGLSVSLLLPLFSQIGISYSAGPGLAGNLLHQALSTIGGSFGISGLLVIIVGLAALQALFFIALHWWMTSVSRSYKRLRQSQLFHAIMHAQWQYVSGKKAGELTNAIVSESERLAQSFYIGLYLISTFLGTCIYLAFGLMIAWPITLALIGSAALMTLSVLRLYAKSFAVGESIAPLNAELQSTLSERISGLKIVKATTSEAAACAQVNSIVGTLERANTVVNFLPMFVRGLFEFLSFCAWLRFLCWVRNVLVFQRETLSSFLPCLCACFHALRPCKAIYIYSTAICTPWTQSRTTKQRRSSCRTVEHG
jgi:ABC-type multidrug transport system, ATPase and permease components